MNPTKLECLRLAVQAGAGMETVVLAREIENYLTSLSSPDSRSPREGTRRRGSRDTRE